jgi:CheY-like chemotaxis protein
MLKKQKSPKGFAVVALGWILLLGGVGGLFLPGVLRALLIAVGAFLLNRRYAWLRRAMDHYRLPFAILRRAWSRIHREKQDREEEQLLCGTRKALIFDEDVEELALYAQPFEAHGVEVHKCASIESAMRCVEREQFDLALVDQVSPSFEGRRVIRHLVRYNWPMPFIVLTQGQDMLRVREALELGAVECLEKPISAAKMNGIIKHFLSDPDTDHKAHGR